MAVNYLASVPKLVGRENYDEWCFAVENVFVLEGLSKCLEGTETDSVLLAKAKAKFVLTLDPSLYVHVKDAATCNEAMKKIQSLYEDVGFTRKIGLLRHLISLRLSSCENMESYVNQVIETSQKLRKTKFDISEEWVGSLLLAGLPDKYAPMLMAIEHAGIAITTDTIKSKLLDMQEENSGSVGKAGAFAASGSNFRNQSRGGSNSNRKVSINSSNQSVDDRRDSDRRQIDRSKIICFKCKQPGHFKSKCPNLSVSSSNSSKYAFSAVFLSGKYNKNDFYLDSGASRHMSPNENALYNKRKPDIEEITVANHEKLAVKCLGDMDISTSVKDTQNNITVYGVLCVPNLTTNLLSVSELIAKGNRVSFNQEGCSIYSRNNDLVATATLVGGVYKVNMKVEKCMLAACDDSELWHRRLAHINCQDLNKMKHCVSGMELKGVARIDKSNCVVCCEGKQTRLPFPTTGTRSNQVLEVIHGDVCGPMETISIGGSKYFLLLVDDFTRMSFVYFLKTKDEVFKYFQEFKTMVEKQQGRNIKIFRSDQGGEFCSNKFERFFQEEGIIHQKTNAYTPEQNGLSERHNRTLVEKARCLLYDAGLPKRFWAEAVNTANYLRNRCIASGLNGKTPFEKWTGKKPDVSGLRIFGSTVMAHIPKEKRLKFDKKACKHILVGFSDHIKGYRIYNPDTDDVTTSRDVIIHENLKTNKMNVSYGSEVTEESVEVGENKQNTQVSENSLHSSLDSLYQQSEEQSSVHMDSTDSDYEPDVPDTTLSDPEAARRSQRPRREKQFTDYVTYLTTAEQNESIVPEEVLVTDDTPVSVLEAMSRPDHAEWKRAIEEELASFEENNAWEIVDKPKDATIVKCKWVFKKKCDSEGDVRYRARLVAKGFSQKPGVDYNETFSPVVRHSSLRLLFALSLKLDLEITHLDVKTAFLNGYLQEIVYMEQPECFVTKGNESKVCKLNRAIYGLKQSSRAWNLRVNEVLLKLNFKRSIFEPCIYTKKDNNLLTIIALYVDDFLIFSNDCKNSKILKECLSSEFKIKDLGQVKQFLGMTICKKKDCLMLSQENYVNQVLKRFNMLDCKSVTTPMESFDFNENNCDTNVNNCQYQKLIGSLMYLAVLTRPDISFSVSFLSKFNNCNNSYHWKCAKRVLRYLKGTKNYVIKFTKDDINLLGYVDADWGSDKADRKSYTGYIFKLSGGPISWKSSKQKTVALSSTEAEYMALSDASKEAIYLRNLVYELTDKLDSVTIFNDNQSAIKLSMNPIFHERSKHIDIRYHFIRETVDKNTIQLKYLETENMIADILTKSVGGTKHMYFVKGLGLEKG